jgi:methionine sulfoxide reductase heme-binding subunit
VIVAASSSQLLWYATRATGIVAFVLLTAVVVLGVLTSRRIETARWPRFATQALHRRMSLLAMVFIGLHVVTTVTDAFVPIGWLAVVVPFTSPYRRLWLGLGAAALDLLLAVMITSWLTRRVSHRTWRAIHWLAYASWPLAFFHALGAGSDAGLAWVRWLALACILAVVGAVGCRLALGGARSDEAAPSRAVRTPHLQGSRR